MAEINNQSNSLTEGKISRQLMGFFFPIWFGTFFQQLYNTADAVIVGNFVGKEALASVGGPTAAIINLLVGFFVGIASGCSVVISQYYGAKDFENTKKSVNTAITFSIVSGFILMAIGIPLSPYLLRWMGTPNEIMTYSTQYMTIYFAGVVFNLIYNIGSGVLRAMGDSKRPLYFLIVCTICNVILDIIFVVVFKMGVRGVAYATIISQLISSILVLVSLKMSYREFDFSLRKLSVDKSILGEMFKIGVPAGLQSVMYSLSNVVIQADINSFGTDTVAAWTAYGKIDAIYWMTVGSFGLSVTTIAGQNYGARKYDRVKESVKVCMKIAGAATIAMSVILIIAGPWIYRIFTSDQEVIKIGLFMLRITAPFYIAYLPVEVFSGAMRGVGTVKIPTFITLFGICVVRVIWSYTVVKPFHQLFLVCISYHITWIIASAAFFIYYKKGNWLKPHELAEAK